MGGVSISNVKCVSSYWIIQDIPGARRPQHVIVSLSAAFSSALSISPSIDEAYASPPSSVPKIVKFSFPSVNDTPSVAFRVACTADPVDSPDISVSLKGFLVSVFDLDMVKTTCALPHRASRSTFGNRMSG